MAVTNVVVQLTHYSFQKDVVCQHRNFLVNLLGIPDRFYGVGDAVGERSCRFSILVI